MDDQTVSNKETDIILTESDGDQQVITVKQEESVKDTDLIMISNNQALTTSLKVAEYFEKKHKHVLDSVEKAINSLLTVNGPNFRPVENGFVETTYTDSKGEKRRMYYLNRNAFTFVVMGFTGEKAAIWKWRYIAAFNRMEETIRKQQQAVKPMTTLAKFRMILEIEENHEKRISNLEDKVKQLRDKDNSIAFRQQKININHQEQIDQNTADIKELKTVMDDKGPVEEIKILISDIVKVTAETDTPYDYQDAYKLFYDQLRRDYDINIAARVTALKRRKTNDGWTKTKVKQISGLDAITADPLIWDKVRETTRYIRSCLTEAYNG